MTELLRFLRNDHGATAVEYALIASAMGVALLAAMPLIATAITGKFSSLAGHITTGK